MTMHSKTTVSLWKNIIETERKMLCTKKLHLLRKCEIKNKDIISND